MYSKGGNVEPCLTPARGGWTEEICQHCRIEKISKEEGLNNKIIRRRLFVESLGYN